MAMSSSTLFVLLSTAVEPMAVVVSTARFPILQHLPLTKK